jgi:hypothetical protein
MILSIVSFYNPRSSKKGSNNQVFSLIACAFIPL